MSTQAHGNRYLSDTVVAVSSAGTGIAWSQGVFHGPPAALSNIARAIRFERHTYLHGVTIKCGAESPLGALAAMASLCPGRTIVTKAPQSVIDTLHNAGYQHPFLPEEHR